MISLPSDTTGRGNVPAESLQKSHDASLCPENKDLCTEELDEDARGKKGVQIVQQNEDSSAAEGTLAELTLNDSGQQNVTVETENSPVLDAVGHTEQIVEEATTEQHSVQETSTNCMAVMPEPISHSVSILEEPKLINSISSDHSGSDFHFAQTEKQSVAEECMAESHTILSERKAESDVNSVATTAVNEGEITLNDPGCSPDSVVNGQMPAFILNPTTLTKDEELSESKNVSVATVNAPSDTNFVSGNGVVKLSGAESKKAKVS